MLRRVMMAGAAAPAGDGISFANVRLLLHGDGADGATIIIDSSSYARTMTVVGSAEIDTAQSVFGGSSLYIPADTNGWTCSSAGGSLDPRGFPFQIDWRHRLAANLTSYSQPDTVLAMVDGSSWMREWAVIVDRDGLRFYVGHRGSDQGHFRFLLPPGYDFGVLGGTSVACSIARDASGNWGAWIEGIRCTQYQVSPVSAGFSYGPVQTGTYVNLFDIGDSGSRTLNVGRFHNFSGLAVTKHIEELRLVIGECRDVFSDYTPLATPFPDS